MPKASAQEFHQTQNTSSTGKPSRRTGPVSPDRFESPQEGLRRLLPEPTPSPRLWAASSGATPARLCEHTTRVVQQPSKPELSTLSGIGTFYFGPTLVMKSNHRASARTG